MADYLFFYVHIQNWGNGIEYYKYITPTLRFELVDALDSRYAINALRIQYEGDAALGGQYYSKWLIDKISFDKPSNIASQVSYVNSLGESKSIPAWYLVSIPANFQPVSYIIDYDTIAPFTFLLSSSQMGDFNKDGSTDILMSNASQGWSGFYTMNGTTATGWVSLPYSSGAVATGAGDFNKDGSTDILMSNASQGWSGFYTMKGTTATGWVSLPYSSGAVAV